MSERENYDDDVPLPPAGCFRAYFVGGSSVVGGLTQAGVEALKIIDGADRDKFPLGWESYNFLEEFVEGSLPVFVGMLAGSLVYHRLIRATKTEYNPVAEGLMMFVGGEIGYYGMVFLGAYLHTVLDVPDVKWGPFK